MLSGPEGALPRLRDIIPVGLGVDAGTICLSADRHPFERTRRWRYTDGARSDLRRALDNAPMAIFLRMMRVAYRSSTAVTKELYGAARDRVLRPDRDDWFSSRKKGICADFIAIKKKKKKKKKKKNSERRHF